MAPEPGVRFGESTTPPDPARSAVRRFLLWWMGHPANPYVCVNAAIDFAPARAYIAALRTQDAAPPVTVQHLLAAAIAQTYKKFPSINARIIGDRIRRIERVGIAMPVNLLGHQGGEARELSMAVVEDLDQMTLRQVAQACTRTVKAERAGSAQNPLVRWLLPAVGALPLPLVFGGLHVVGAVSRHPLLAHRLFQLAPVTTALTNPGAAFGQVPGMLFRGGSIAVPTRMGHVGSLWGVAPVQDEAVALDGQVVVRPMLPVLYCFDHRLVDGVMAGRILVHFGRLLATPAAAFGADGNQLPVDPT